MFNQKLYDTAYNKAISVQSLRDVSSSHGYTEALCHANIITNKQMDDLHVLAVTSIYNFIRESQSNK